MARLTLGSEAAVLARVGLIDQGIDRHLRWRDACGFLPNRFAI
jgi:hypothetical protein